MPYRLYVPSSWDGKSMLPMIVFLHGAGSDENRYIDANDRQLIHLAEKHGFNLEYMEVDADHGGMIPLVLPGIFDFFKKHSKPAVN